MKTNERAVCVAVAAVLLGGCHETLTQLEPQLIAPATHPALVFSRSLPELGDIVRGPDQPAGFDGSGVVAETESLVSRWDASWDQGTGEGQALREAIYRAVASGAADLDEAAIRSMMDAVRQAVIEAGIRARVLPPHLAGPLDGARRYVAEAERAREAGAAAGMGAGRAEGGGCAAGDHAAKGRAAPADRGRGGDGGRGGHGRFANRLGAPPPKARNPLRTTLPRAAMTPAG